MKYFLFIDGDFFGSYETLEAAKKDCYCGNTFTIYKVEVEWVSNDEEE